MVFALFLFFVAVVFALFLFFVVFEFHARGESNGLDVVSYMEHRRAGLFHCFKGVAQALLEVEAVGHNHDSAFHSASILQ